MMTLVIALRTYMRTPRGRRIAAQRALVGLLSLAMLLIPATCAEAAGPHSMFIDPTPGALHHAAGPLAGHAQPMTQAELEQQVLFGNGLRDTGHTANQEASTRADLPTGPDGTRVSDLPSTMAMAAATMPAVLNDDLTLELPVADLPVAYEPIAPALTTVSPESPPPQQ